MDTVQRARRGLVIFFAVLILLSIPVQWNIIKNGLSVANALPFFWAPGTAAIVTRLLLGEGFKDVSFRFRRDTQKAALIAWFYPLAVGTVAYGTAWITGLAELSPATQHKYGIDFPSTTPTGLLLAGLTFSLTIGTPLGMLLALGEEIGWRGYVLTRLIDARIPRPILTSGLIWGAWHLPLIAAGEYLPSPNLALSAITFMLSMVALSYLMARLRLETGSIWPAVILHASWNELILLFFNPSTRGPRAAYWVGESGFLVTGCALLLTMLLARGRSPLRRHPADASRVKVRILQM